MRKWKIIIMSRKEGQKNDNFFHNAKKVVLRSTPKRGRPQSPCSVAASPPPDQNELALAPALGFKQWPYEIDVAIEHMHACLGQNQGFKSIFASSLFNKFPVLFCCSDIFDSQLVIRHRARTLHLYEQIYGDKFCDICSPRG